MTDQDRCPFVTPDMTVEEIVRRYPPTLHVLLEYGLKCAACRIGVFHTLGDSAQSYGVDVEELLDVLNRVVAT